MGNSSSHESPKQPTYTHTYTYISLEPFGAKHIASEERPEEPNKKYP